MSFSQDDHMYTVQEVSSILKLSTLTIYKYIKEQTLDAVEFGGHYRIKQSSLEAFINQHSVTKKTSGDKGGLDER